MRTVWKVQLEPAGDDQWFELPFSANVVHVGAQRVVEPIARYERVAVWLDLDTDHAKVLVGFAMRDTGMPAPMVTARDRAQHVGTALLDGGRTVRHVYALGRRELMEP